MHMRVLYPWNSIQACYYYYEQSNKWLFNNTSARKTVGANTLYIAPYPRQIGEVCCLQITNYHVFGFLVLLLKELMYSDRKKTVMRMWFIENDLITKRQWQKFTNNDIDKSKTILINTNQSMGFVLQTIYGKHWTIDLAITCAGVIRIRKLYNIDVFINDVGNSKQTKCWKIISWQTKQFHTFIYTQ